MNNIDIIKTIINSPVAMPPFFPLTIVLQTPFAQRNYENLQEFHLSVYA